jgi:hypothetical protein
VLRPPAGHWVPRSGPRPRRLARSRAPSPWRRRGDLVAGPRRRGTHGQREEGRAPAGPPPPASFPSALRVFPRNERAVSPPRGELPPYACFTGSALGKSRACPPYSAVEATTQPRHPPPSQGGPPGTLTFLVGHGGRRSGGIPASSVAGGAGRLRALAPRARPLLFPAAPA